jgi:hypothetical protein
MNEMGGTFDTIGKKKRRRRGVGLGNLKETSHMECAGVRWKYNIKIDNKEVGWKDVDWMKPA